MPRGFPVSAHSAGPTQSFLSSPVKPMMHLMGAADRGRACRRSGDHGRHRLGPCRRGCSRRRSEDVIFPPVGHSLGG
jgi:hypothetical protein